MLIAFLAKEADASVVRAVVCICVCVCKCVCVCVCLCVCELYTNTGAHRPFCEQGERGTKLCLGWVLQRFCLDLPLRGF